MALSALYRVIFHIVECILVGWTNLTPLSRFRMRNFSSSLGGLHLVIVFRFNKTLFLNICFANEGYFKFVCV